jgi:hypothetical protein
MPSIKDWAASGSVKNILQFLGSANFYRHFIDGFSKVARPLTALTAFNWAEAARSALVTSKHLFTVAPILVHFHPEKPTVVETDASDFALGTVLSDQEAPSGGLSLAEIQASRDKLRRPRQGNACYRDGI